MKQIRKMDHERGRWIRLATMVICIAIYLYFVGRCCDCTVDDTFIAMRYAQNLMRGNGLVFNAGERVEGFSNPLWILIISFCTFLPIDLLVAIKGLGILCWIILLMIMQKMAQNHFDISAGVSFWMGTYLATSIGLVYFSISGLETIFFAMEILLMNYFLLERRFLSASLACAAIILTRPEGILYLLPLAAFLQREGQEQRYRYRFLLPPIVALLLLYTGRLLYYGEWLPNTFYVKIHPESTLLGYLLNHLIILIRYTYESFDSGQIILLFAVIYLLFFVNRRHIGVVLTLGMALFFIWFSSLDWMPFGRFYQPAMPLIILLAFAGLEKMKTWISSSFGRLRLIHICLALPTILNAVHAHYQIRALHAGETINPAMHSQNHIIVGRYLREIGSPQNWLVTNEIGAIGYYSGMQVMDMIGLTDKNIPRLRQQGTLSDYAGYIFAKNPKFVLLNDRQTPTDYRMHPYHEALYQKMMQLGDYKFRKQFALNSYKNILLFERIDSN